MFFSCMILRSTVLRERLYSRFTKWRCVRGKNPQKIHLYVLIQNLPLISKMGIAALLIQRPTNGSHFSFFFKNYLVFFTYFLFVSSNCRKFHQNNHPTKENRRTSWVRRFCFHSPLRSKSYSKWKMEAIWRPLN